MLLVINLQSEEIRIMSESTETKASPSLSDEFGKLGQNLGNLLKSLWNTDERHYVEKEIKSGMQQFTSGLDNAIESIKTDDTMKKVGSMAKDVWETAHGPQIMSEVQMGIAELLRRVNEELKEKAERKPAHEASVVNGNEPSTNGHAKETVTTEVETKVEPVMVKPVEPETPPLSVP